MLAIITPIRKEVVLRDPEKRTHVLLLADLSLDKNKKAGSATYHSSYQDAKEAYLSTHILT